MGRYFFSTEIFAWKEICTYGCETTHILIDLSSTAEFGVVTEVTDILVPTDVRVDKLIHGCYKSEEILDWWMLGDTFCWLLDQSVVNKDINKNEVIEVLSKSHISKKFEEVIQ